MEWFWLSLGIAILVIELVTTKLYAASVSISSFITAIILFIMKENKQPFSSKWQILFFACLSIVLSALTFVIKLIISKRKK